MGNKIKVPKRPWLNANGLLLNTSGRLVLSAVNFAQMDMGAHFGSADWYWDHELKNGEFRIRALFKQFRNFLLDHSPRQLGIAMASWPRVDAH